MKLLIILLFSTIQLFSYSMDEYILKHNDLNSFNYKEYLNSTSLLNIPQLNKDRHIAQQKNLGNSFLYKLTDYFIKNKPVDMNTLNMHIHIGEKFLDFYQKNPKDNDIYEYIGYYILSTASHLLEKEIAKNSSDWFFFIKNFSKIKEIKFRLVKSKIFIKAKNHTAKKLIDNIRYGHFKYMWNRFYLKYFYVEKTTKKSKLSLQEFKVNNIIDNQIFSILNNNNKIGEMIWLENSKYKMYYLAEGNIKNKYQKFLSSTETKVRIALTGGFINDHSYPEGLTIENGNIINASLLPNRDALVIIENTGISHIINLKKKNFILPNKKRINPLHYAFDYASLLNWSKTNHGSIFQTQLLAYNDKLLFHLNSNKKKQKRYIRERRLLAIVNDPKKHKSFHIIINIREGVTLALITNKIFKIMKEKKYHIEAILNLDVGSYNIMNVYDKNGSMILTSPRQIKNAKNLLFYTQ